MMKIRREVNGLFTSRKGFTFVELLIAVVISFIIMAAVFEVLITQKRSYALEDTLLEVENRGEFTVQYLTHLIQNSGYNINQGMKIESASDYYFTTVFDEDDNGVIEADEIVTICMNKPYRNIGDTEQPTGLVHDADMDNLANGGPHEYFFDYFFDMNGDGDVLDNERFVSGYNLDNARDDTNSDQKDAIKLFITGPPYGLYRYACRLENEETPYGPSNPYIVDPEPDLIADNVDNFIIRYFDEEDLPLPITRDASGNRIAPVPPYVLTREEMAKIRRMEFEVLLRTHQKDMKWEDSGRYPTGSIATYGADGKPKGWSCGDSAFPPSPLCDGLSDWECFLKYCNEKSYPSYGDSIPYQDNFRRLLLTTSVTPKNLILNPYGSLSLSIDPPKVMCPHTEATLTAVLRDRNGDPIPGVVVEFTSTKDISAIDLSVASLLNADGKPITDEDGRITDVKLKPATPASGKRLPVTVTVSASSLITVSINGVDTEFPVYSSSVVPFVVGPPSVIEFTNAPTSAFACDASGGGEKEIVIYAKDCNGFSVEGATIDMSLYNYDNESVPIPTDVDSGRYFIKEDDGSKLYQNIAEDYSDSLGDLGEYRVYYEPPIVSPPKTTYVRNVGIRSTATKFEGKPLSEPEPDGWNTVSPTRTTSVVIETGRLDSISITPVTFSGSGCKNTTMELDARGFDCGLVPLDNTLFETFASIIGSPKMGLLYKPDGTELGDTNAKLVWDSAGLMYRVIFLNTGCALGDIDETISFLGKDPAKDPDPLAKSAVTPISLSQCPQGLNITLRAREPHTTPAGGGTYSDGFYQDGCDYNSLDIEARVILNLPPNIQCQDIVSNSVQFEVIEGGARFLDASGNPTLTTLTVNTNADGKTLAPIKLTGTSLAEVRVRVSSSYGTSPVYSATAEINLPVGPEEVVYAYRDHCYTNRLTPSVALRNNDTVYVEVLDCNRDTTANPDQTTVRVFEAVTGFNDEQDLTLTETGGHTGIFRGSIRTRANPIGAAPELNDGIIDTINGGTFNIRYLDEATNPYWLYRTAPFVQTIVDACDGGIRFSEIFTNESYDGLLSDLSKFPFTSSANWRGFSTLNLTSSTSPSLAPNAQTFKRLILQFCDDMFLSGSIPFSYLWTANTISLPPTVAPVVTSSESETFMWVDLDENVVGVEASENEWEDLTVSYRFKFVADPDDPRYTGTSVISVNNYYLPGVDKGVVLLFRVHASSQVLSGLPGTPQMDIIDRGYLMVWTKDSHGDPLVRLLRIDSINTTVNPIQVNITRIGDDITAPNFTLQYDSDVYHTIEARLEGNDFFLYIDDVYLDFDGLGGPSATDRNYTKGTLGFGVKDIIGKFDNLQVCGCPPMGITSDDAAFPTGSSVKLTLKDMLYGSNAPAPTTWTVEPSGCGTFSSNPSNQAFINFTRTGLFPTRFTAFDDRGCVGNLYPVPPIPPCFIDDFNDGTAGGWVHCTANWLVESYGGSQVFHLTGTSTNVHSNTDSAAQSLWRTYATTGGYDNYIVQADVTLDNSSSYSAGGSVAGVIVRFIDCTHFYTLAIRNESNTGYDNGYEVRLRRYDGSWTRIYGAELGNVFAAGTWYTLNLRVQGKTFTGRVTNRATGAEIASFTVTDPDMPTSLYVGSPGAVTIGNGARFDNVNICPITP
jgi:hypothetical protein